MSAGGALPEEYVNSKDVQRAGAGPLNKYGRVDNSKIGNRRTFDQLSDSDKANINKALDLTSSSALVDQSFVSDEVKATMSTVETQALMNGFGSNTEAYIKTTATEKAFLELMYDPQFNKAVSSGQNYHDLLKQDPYKDTLRRIENDIRGAFTRSGEVFSNLANKIDETAQTKGPYEKDRRAKQQKQIDIDQGKTFAQNKSAESRRGGGTSGSVTGVNSNVRAGLGGIDSSVPTILGG